MNAILSSDPVPLITDSQIYDILEHELTERTHPAWEMGTASLDTIMRETILTRGIPPYARYLPKDDLKFVHETLIEAYENFMKKDKRLSKTMNDARADLYDSMFGIRKTTGKNLQKEKNDFEVINAWFKTLQRHANAKWCYASHMSDEYRAQIRWLNVANIRDNILLLDIFKYAARPIVYLRHLGLPLHSHQMVLWSRLQANRKTMCRISKSHHSPSKCWLSLSSRALQKSSHIVGIGDSLWWDSMNFCITDPGKYQIHDTGYNLTSRGTHC